MQMLFDIKFFLLFILTYLLVSCTGNSTSYLRQEEGSFSKDTTRINQMLNQILSHPHENTDSSIAHLTKAKELSEKIGYPEGTARSFFLEGNVYYAANHYDMALKSYTQSLNMAEASGNILLKAQCLEYIALVNLTIGDDFQSLKLYYEALPLFEQTGDKEGIADVYNIIGLYKSSQGEYDTAATYFQKAIQLNEQIGNQTGLIHNKGNLAFMYHEMGNTDRAKAIDLQLIPKLVETDDGINLAVIYYDLSIFSEANMEPDSTLYYLRKAMVVSGKLADTSMLTTIYGRIGEIHLNQQQYDSASSLLTISAKMAHAIDDYVTEKMAIKFLITIDTINRNYKKATKRYAQLIAVSDSVYNQRLRNNLEASELRYENQKKSSLIETQKNDLATASRQKQLLVFLFLFLVLILLLLVLLIILFKRNNIRKQELLNEEIRINELELENIKHKEEINKLRIEKIEKEIKIKENEQVSHALALEQKNELLAVINKKFTEAIQDKGSINLSELKGLVSTIKSQVRDLSDIDLFNQKFNQLHQNFFHKIKEAHPKLTKTELKFCAYLKLNLTSSQIANIQNVTSEAVRKTRYRIRKKINLSTKDSLEDYISGF